MAKKTSLKITGFPPPPPPPPPPCAVDSIPADFGLSNGLVHNVDVQCSGAEMSLSECLSDSDSGSGKLLVPVSTDPRHCSNHAGVICEG